MVTSTGETSASELSEPVDELYDIWKFSRWISEMDWRYDANPVKTIEDKIQDACIALSKNGANAQDVSDGKNFIINGRSIPFTDECILLAHWLTYVYDYQMPADSIWDNLFPIMLLISIEFKKKGIGVLNEFVKTEKTENGKMTRKFQLGNLEFKHRFETSHRIFPFLRRTLQTLEDHHNRSLLDYLSSSLRDKSKADFTDERNHIRGLAFHLNALTYGDDKPPASYLLHPTGYTFVGHKRLWAAVRDMVVFPLYWQSLQGLGFFKPGSYDFRNRDSYLEQLELPGDLWNNRLMHELKARLAIKHSSASSGDLARQLYNSIELLRKEHLYPVYLDASYSIGWNERSATFIRRTLAAGRNSPLCTAAEAKICPLVAYLTADSRLCSVKDCLVFARNKDELPQVKSIILPENVGPMLSSDPVTRPDSA